MEVSLYPLLKGTIRNIFSPMRFSRPVKDPVALPQDQSKCVHVDVIFSEDGGGVSYIRCANLTDYNDRHGWLCSEHYFRTQGPMPKGEAARRDYEKETIDSIKRVEAEGLTKFKRITVGKARVKFHTLDVPADSPLRREIKEQVVEEPEEDLND